MSHTLKINKQYRKLFDPKIIAIIASLGIHGFILQIALPKLQVSKPDENPETKLKVNIIELTPIEQTLLPNIESQQIGLSKPLPNLPNLNIPNSSLLLPRINPNYNPRHPILQIPYNPYNLRRLPSNIIPLPNNLGNLPNTIPIPSLNNLPISQNQIPQIPINLPQLPQLPPPPPQQFLNQNNINNFNPPKPEINESSSNKTPTLEANSEENINRNINDATNNSTENNTNNNQENLLNKIDPIEIAAKQEENLVAQIQKLAETLVLDENSPTEEEIEKNNLIWSAQINEVTPEEITITGNYPLDACIRKLEGTSTYGIIVNNQGEISDLKLLATAGYPLFNENGLKSIKSMNLTNQTSLPKPYQININFKYDPNICPSLSIPEVESSKSNENPILIPEESQNTNEEKPLTSESKESNNDAETNLKPESTTELTVESPVNQDKIENQN